MWEVVFHCLRSFLIFFVECTRLYIWLYIKLRISTINVAPWLKVAAGLSHSFEPPWRPWCSLGCGHGLLAQVVWHEHVCVCVNAYTSILIAEQTPASKFFPCQTDTWINWGHTKDGNTLKGYLHWKMIWAWTKQVTWQSTLPEKHVTWLMHGKASYLTKHVIWQSTLPDKAHYLIHARQSMLPAWTKHVTWKITLPDSCTAKHVTWLMRGKCMQLSAGPQQEVMLGSKDHGCIEQLRALKGLIVDRRICRRSRPRVTIQ